MEPTNQPFRKEHDLPNLHEEMFQPLIFQGVSPNKNYGLIKNPNGPWMVVIYFLRLNETVKTSSVFTNWNMPGCDD